MLVAVALVVYVYRVAPHPLRLTPLVIVVAAVRTRRYPPSTALLRLWKVSRRCRDPRDHPRSSFPFCCWPARLLDDCQPRHRRQRRFCPSTTYRPWQTALPSTQSMKQVHQCCCHNTPCTFENAASSAPLSSIPRPGLSFLPSRLSLLVTLLRHQLRLLAFWRCSGERYGAAFG